MTDNLYNPSFRTSAFLTVRSQFNYNFMPVYSFFWLTLWNKNVLKNSLVIRNDKAITLVALLLIKTDNCCKTTLHNLYNLTFPALSITIRSLRNNHFYYVTIQRSAGIVLPDKNILILLRNDNKTKPSLIRTVSSLKTLRLTFTVLSTLTETDLTFLFQWFQHLTKLIPLLLIHLQDHSHLFELHWHIHIITDKIIYNFLSFLKCLIAHRSSTVKKKHSYTGVLFLFS